MLWNYHFLVLISTNIIRNVRKKINKRVRQIANKLDCVFLGAHAWRKWLSYNEIERGPGKVAFTTILRTHLLIGGELGIVLFHNRKMNHVLLILVRHIDCGSSFTSLAIFFGRWILTSLTLKLSLVFNRLRWFDRLLQLVTATGMNHHLFITLGGGIFLLNCRLIVKANLIRGIVAQENSLSLHVFIQLLIQPLDLHCKSFFSLTIFYWNWQRNAQVICICILDTYWLSLRCAWNCSLLDQLFYGVQLAGSFSRTTTRMFLNSFWSFWYLINLIIWRNRFLVSRIIGWIGASI